MSHMSAIFNLLFSESCYSIFNFTFSSKTSHSWTSCCSDIMSMSNSLNLLNNVKHKNMTPIFAYYPVSTLYIFNSKSTLAILLVTSVISLSDVTNADFGVTIMLKIYRISATVGKQQSKSSQNSCDIGDIFTVSQSFLLCVIHCLLFRFKFLLPYLDFA